MIIRDGFFTKNKPYWIEPISDNIFYNKKLIKIITFYLFHCPCKNVFNIGKNFSEYGWDNLNVLNRILRKETDASCVSVFASTYKELKEKLIEVNLGENFPSDYDKERLCVIDSESNQFSSLFKHIRNSLAHGRLQIINNHGYDIYIFEDVERSSNDLVRVSGRMILSQKTLIKWIDIIEECEVYKSNKLATDFK